MALRKEEYFCKYCDYRTDKLYDSYLCPRCRHVLLPVHPKGVKKKSNPVVVVSLLIVIAACSVFIYSQLFPGKLSSFFDGLRQFPQTAGNSDTTVAGNEYLFSGVTTDVLTSRIDGKTYFVVEGKVAPQNRIVFHNELVLSLLQNGTVIYREKRQVETLTPGKQHSFRFEVDLADIQGYDPLLPIQSKVQISGKSIA